MKPSSALIVAVAVLVVVATSVGEGIAADVPPDVSGDWSVTLSIEVEGWTYYTSCLLYLDQEIDVISGPMACADAGSGHVEGKIDKAGAFEFSANDPPLPSTVVGTVSLDDVLQGTWRLLDISSGYFGARRPAVAQWGDASCDYEVNGGDAVRLLQEVAEARLVPARCSWYADVNVDGIISAIDALLILQREAGLLDRLPVV